MMGVEVGSGSGMQIIPFLMGCLIAYILVKACVEAIKETFWPTPEEPVYDQEFWESSWGRAAADSMERDRLRQEVRKRDDDAS